jgi:hypothetical protein
LRTEEKRIVARLAVLPKGRIRSRKIGGDVYYYLQYRKGGAVKTDYLGKEVPGGLKDRLAERDALQAELIRVRDGLRLLRDREKGDLDLAEPLLAVFRELTRRKLWDAGLEIAGSWCFLLYQKYLPMERYPLRTEDLDILVPRPFKGQPYDLARFLQGMGFRQEFNPDGSMFFSGHLIKIEFLTRERRNGTNPPRYVKELSLTPQELRFLDILFRDRPFPRRPDPVYYPTKRKIERFVGQDLPAFGHSTPQAGRGIHLSTLFLGLEPNRFQVS